MSKKNSIGHKKFVDPKFFYLKIFDSTKFLIRRHSKSRTNLSPKNVYVSKILGLKKSVPQKLVSKTNIFKVPKIWVKLNFCKKIYIKEVKACKKSGPKRLVKFGSVTAKILPIWTNVTRTNDALTNVTVTVCFC